MYIIAGETEKAEQTADEIEKYLTRYPNFLLVHLNLGYLYARMKEFGKARIPLLRAIELGDYHARSFGHLGYSYQLDGEWLLAEMFYREANKRDPENPEWINGLNQMIDAQNKVRKLQVKEVDTN